MSSFDELVRLKRDNSFVYEAAGARAVFAPDLGARVFCELGGLSLHRLDIENVRHPDRPFNNYGGNNFWPAPEGGRFGFNYDRDTWRVQRAINDQPFVLDAADGCQARASKRTTLVNRLGVSVDVVMERAFAAGAASRLVSALCPAACFGYTVTDRIEVRNRVNMDEALLACWTLEQFDASNATTSFARVACPREAINFDFYDHPGDWISYAPGGFYYRTDSRKRGQIGIRKNFNPGLLGFFDLGRKLLCVREIAGPQEGLYFNIADNDQPQGPFSAQDTYSIFNGDEALRFFELETVGGALVDDDYLQGSVLTSMTSFALFESADPIRQFLTETINKGENENGLSANR